jgi:hypothetical protein
MASRRTLVEQLRERFRRDFIAACEKVYYIKPRDSTQLALFTLWPEQQRQAEIMLDQQRRGRPVRIVRLKTRQAGDSTLGEAWLFHQVHWNPRTNGLLVAHDEVATNAIFEIPRTIYQELPRELQHPLKKLNRRELAFEEPHNSILSTATAGWQGLGRGRTIQHIHISEVDYFPDPVTALDGLMETCPVSPGTSIVMESTASSAEGWLRGFWEACKRGETLFVPLFTPWFKVPEYRLPVDGPITLSDEEHEWVAKYHVTPEQILWYRAKKAEMMAREPWGGERKMRREYPCCLVASTRVSTDRGIIPIAEAAAGQASESGRILGLYPQGEADVVQAWTRDGRTLSGTADHPLQRPDGTFVELAESVGALIELRPPRFADSPYTLRWSEIGGITSELVVDERWGRFLGYFMGDGSYSTTSRSSAGYVSIVCTGKDTDVVDDVVGLMTALFGGGHTRGMGSRSVAGVRGAIEVRVGCMGFLPIMKGLGIWKDWRPHRRVCVPEAIFRSPQPVVREFLRGLFEADGFNGYGGNKVSLFSKWPEFIRDVQLLLLGFGITSRVTSVPRSNTDHAYTKNELTLRSRESQRFNAEIGFIGRRKSGRFVPLSRFNKHAKPMEMLDQVVRVEPAGRAPVYDLSIEGRHTFSANGLVVHNTDDEAFQAAGLCVFPDVVLQRLKEGLSKPVLSFRLVATGHGELIDVPMTDWQDGDLWVWESPKEGAFYSLGVDVSDGVGKTESVVSVCRYPGYEQVAEWASDKTSPEHTAWVARWLAEKYGGPSAMVIPETNKSGVLVLHILQTMSGTFSIFRWRYLDKPAIPETEFPTLGWQTNVRTKPLLAQVANMIYLRSNGEGVIRSHVLHDQMKRCIDLVPGVRWRAEGRDTDRVLAWMIALIGAYLEFEGGQVGGLGADRDFEADEKKRREKPHRSQYDADWDEVLAGGAVRMGSGRLAWDTLAE